MTKGEVVKREGYHHGDLDRSRDPRLCRCGGRCAALFPQCPSYISTLQAEGIEVGLVAKLAGHANPSVTLSVYSHAVRGGDMAAETLEKAYAAKADQLWKVLTRAFVPHKCLLATLCGGL